MSIVLKFPHLCSADVYHNGDRGRADPFNWSSHFLWGVVSTMRWLLAQLTNRSLVPAWVLLIAHLHVGEGGAEDP